MPGFSAPNFSGQNAQLGLGLSEMMEKAKQYRLGLGQQQSQFAQSLGYQREQDAEARKLARELGDQSWYQALLQGILTGTGSVMGGVGAGLWGRK